MANTQTSVPLFVANAVLTAAQQNISAATGVPVFATTVTRDAAFGGSNKALAEGQLCYLESTNVVQYYDGAAWLTLAGGAGQVLQVVSFSSITEVSTTSTSYVTTGLTATITPSSTSSNIFIVASTGGRLSGNANLGSYTLFRGTVAGTNLGTASVGFGYIHSGAGELFEHVAISYLDSPATVSAQVYTMGMNVGAATVSVQAQRGPSRGTITLMEISG